MPKWKKAIISEIIDCTDQLRLIKLNVDSDDIRGFIPGQFITMDLPVGEKRLDRWRSYSIANNPEDDGCIELCLVKVPEGKATTYLFEGVNPGTHITYKGPEGNFILPQTIQEKIIMICTGTGVAPFRSMIKSIQKKSIDKPQVHLIFGTRTRKDILYYEELDQIAQGSNWLEYSIALSREEFKGYKGYVHGIYDRISSEELKNSKIYLCGWQNMIDEAVDQLINHHGVRRADIHYELYG